MRRVPPHPQSYFISSRRHGSFFADRARDRRAIGGAWQTATGKHSPPGKGNIYAKANEVIVKITGGDTDQTFEVVEENCKPGFQSRAHYHIKAYETFYVFDGSADFQVGDELFHAKKGSCVHIPPGVSTR